MEEIDRPVLTEQQLFEYLRDELGIVGVTRSSVKFAVIKREITPTRIGRCNYFSQRDGLDWVASLKQRAVAG
ncbi:hypothetical protein H7J08_07875 [Mycobacterium frederiksbergense]|uniref:hypothetical protein n=1 Tax=Mycolicibacterium frederiksbergense TaxID=117567 RepID=UPI0021F36B73|nr:hypothetical protein [Mycolicibacterium frederiksbergense]MCV7044590.1 hypothetical protein [Mycolicibacterium frederiksbergense]